jgi:hypothetical protein
MRVFLAWLYAAHHYRAGRVRASTENRSGTKRWEKP